LVESKALKRLKRKLETEVLWIYVSHLLRSGAKSANELKKELRDRFGIRVSSIKLYSILYRMEGEGLIEKAGANPIRYSLTQLGEIEYKKALLYIEERLLMLKTHIGF